ncbi:efflux RND transporter periplasmic adaptor subunit, partial [Gammaproteobacteria bacterium]|nr:efflux RND transporter periplasmic adaptor subunit [Gammaproteobacteria bacterium]
MKKALILIGILAIVIAIPLIRNKGGGQVPEVEVETLTARAIRSSILASGKLAHEEEVLLSTEVIGKVSGLFVAEGDYVSEGQIVLQIDDEALRALVEQRQASVKVQEIAIESGRVKISNLETQLGRKEQLFERGLLDEDSFQLAENELELAKLDLESREASLVQSNALLQEANKNLSKTSVYSPLDGMVTSLDIKVGETAISSTTNVPGSSLMTIANPDSIQTEINVDEADIANVAVGQEAEIVAIAYPDLPMKGRVESIAISAKQPSGSQSLSFEVKIIFTDTNGVVLRPGMSCRAEIFTNTNEEVLAVPIQAIQIEEDIELNETMFTVFVNDAGIARKKDVEVGISDDQYQEIISGLNAGEQVIIGPDRALRSL